MKNTRLPSHIFLICTHKKKIIIFSGLARKKNLIKIKLSQFLNIFNVKKKLLKVLSLAQLKKVISEISTLFCLVAVLVYKYITFENFQKLIYLLYRIAYKTANTIVEILGLLIGIRISFFFIGPINEALMIAFGPTHFKLLIHLSIEFLVPKMDAFFYLLAVNVIVTLDNILRFFLF